MGEGVLNKTSTQTAQIGGSTPPNEGLVPSPHALVKGERVELSAWLERVGTLNAIAAILEAEQQRQQTALAAPADPVSAAATGIEGLGWLADAVTAAFKNHLQASGAEEPCTVTIPLELQFTPAKPRRPHRTAETAERQQSGWVPMGRISLGRPASDRPAPYHPHHGRPAASAQAPIATQGKERTWTLVSEQHLQAHLTNFLAPADAPADIKTAVAGLMAWWKLHEASISDADSNELIGLLHGFIRSWLSQQDPKALPEPTTRLLAAATDGAPATPELEATLYSSRDLARELNYQDSTIRRCASQSWRQGPGPHPLRGIPGFYVVARPNPGCGRGRGWKFRRVKATCGGLSQTSGTTIRQLR